MSDEAAAVAEPIEEAPEVAAEAPVAEPAGKGKAKDKKEKDKKEQKGKKGKKGEEQADGAGSGAPNIAAHPRAARSVAKAKGWGALIGFLLGGYLSLPTHTVADAGLRALAAGATLYVAAWAAAVFAWRRLVMVEIRAREAQLVAAAKAAREQRQGALQAPAQGRQNPGNA